MDAQLGSLKLDKIAKWQLLSQETMVSLPTMQRGFVWNSKKIEDLWDSLLREYPIGSFLLVRRKNDGFWLMDGQQRATAIALGFYNPFSPENSEKKLAR